MVRPEPEPDPGPEPGLGAGHVAVGKKKKWATKSRTGCLTCRKRRVKCDEATPICRRWSTGYFNCHYGALIRLGDATRQNDHDDRGGLERSAYARRVKQTSEEHIYTEVEPFDWDYQQAIRYYFAVISPARCAEGGKVV